MGRDRGGLAPWGPYLPTGGPRVATPAKEAVTVVNPRPVAASQGSDTLLPGGARPLRAAEITAIGAGRRLYCADIVGADATADSIMSHAPVLQPPERQALSQIGERSFGICAHAGVLYQQAADLLSELRER
jgi:hypothetical protein